MALYAASRYSRKFLETELRKTCFKMDENPCLQAYAEVNVPLIQEAGLGDGVFEKQRSLPDVPADGGEAAVSGLVHDGAFGSAPERGGGARHQRSDDDILRGRIVSG